MRSLGARRLIDRLITKGVTDIFGYPGGAILPVLNELHNHKKIKYYLSRTEQGAGFMADGYAKSTGRLGVVMTTSGPGALNIITCLQNALSDGTPMLALTGQVSTAVLGTDAFQEADVIGISKPCTKWNSMIRTASHIDLSVDWAVLKAFDKRPGPVLLDLPKNIMSMDLSALTEFTAPTPFTPPTAVTAVTAFTAFTASLEPTISIAQITKLILASKRPVILAGQGVIQAGPDAISYLRSLAKLYRIPVTTTLMGLGAFDEKHALSLKMLGMHGSYYANNAIQNCDLLLNFGSRFDDRITGDVTKFAKGATIVHVDICAENINKVIKTPHYINSCCSKVLKALVDARVSSKLAKYDPGCNSEWHTRISEWKKTPFSYPRSTSILQGREVIAVLNRILYSANFKYNRFTIVADVGAHQMWAAQFIDYNSYRIRFFTSGGLGSMGYAVPAAIGAALGGSDETVICICGDGGFTMSFVELLTAVENRVNVKVLIINNSYQLMVKMWQDKFYDKRHVGVAMKNPPFEKVCAAMGCESLLIDSMDGLEEKLTHFINYTGGPIVANVITNSSEAVLPMVSPGKALDDMIVHDSDEKLLGDAPC